jgi:hypothetical protein
MAQTEIRWPVSLSLFGQKLGRKQKGSAIRHLPSLRRSCRRSGCSPAEPYPPHECQHSIMHFYLPFAKGTSLLCRTGDISTLH